MKSYTDLEQSKKLAEFLPLKSADMDYIPIVNLDGEYSISVNEWNNDHVIDEGWIPCWSLAALLEVIPKYIEDHYVLRMDYNKDFSIWYDEVGYYGVDIELPDITKDSIIDACYEMVLKLHDKNLI